MFYNDGNIKNNWINWGEKTEKKVRHKLLDIVVIVLFAKLANADDWEKIEIFAKTNEEFLKQYIALENGIPSHDIIQRVMGHSKKSFVLMEKPWKATDQKNRKQTILFPHGVTWTVSALDRKKWKKSQMRSQQSWNCWIPYSKKEAFEVGKKMSLRKNVIVYVQMQKNI